MSKEAMKLALEALESLPALSWIPEKAMQVQEAIKALEEALAKQEQSVSVGGPEMVRNMRMWVTALKSVSDNGQHMKIPSELSSGTCWELAIALEKFIDTTPQPKRNPLTERELLDFWLARFDVEGSPINNFARAIEAAHGIKE